MRTISAATTAIAVTSLVLSGCSTMISSATSRMTDNLASAILNQNDPETVRDGAPAYLLMMDSLVEGSPDDSEILQAAAKLYSMYGAAFADDLDRAKRLTERARGYGQRALCAENNDTCNLAALGFDDYDKALTGLDDGDVPALFAYSISWLAYIRAHTDDWNALAELPKAQSAVNRLHELNPEFERGTIHLYLGILATIRPPALGGRPEEAKVHFEEAIELSSSKDLRVQVEYARSYARMMYDRELHDRLLTQVIEADPIAEGLTLFNIIAQRDAHELLASADDYF
jgi:tetratricopeptide (TPR) repeat protein